MLNGKHTLFREEQLIKYQNLAQENKKTLIFNAFDFRQFITTQNDITFFNEEHNKNKQPKHEKFAEILIYKIIAAKII